MYVHITLEISHHHLKYISFQRIISQTPWLTWQHQGVCCGASHSLARTASGLLWAWGCNEHGQLGLGDTKPRFRPEQVRFAMKKGPGFVA